MRTLPRFLVQRSQVPLFGRAGISPPKAGCLRGVAIFGDQTRARKIPLGAVNKAADREHSAQRRSSFQFVRAPIRRHPAREATRAAAPATARPCSSTAANKAVMLSAS